MAHCGNVGISAALALCGFASALAQTTAPVRPAPEPVTAADRNRTAQRFLDDRLAIWRQRLKLEDWQISVAMTRDLPPQTLGAIRWDKTKKSAVIWALYPDAYQLPFRQTLDDLELTIVHELVHLDLTSLPRGQASRGSEERAVTGIAAALLGLDHKDR
jgi:hypothetical protein